MQLSRRSDIRINKNKEAEKLPYFVGVPRFELGTSCSQSRRTNRAVLHPEDAVPFGFAIAKLGYLSGLCKYFNAKICIIFCMIMIFSVL